eukprot:1392108-Amorphochlora_amoeboformis.AAC.1
MERGWDSLGKKCNLLGFVRRKRRGMEWVSSTKSTPEKRRGSKSSRLSVSRVSLGEIEVLSPTNTKNRPPCREGSQGIKILMSVFAMLCSARHLPMAIERVEDDELFPDYKGAEFRIGEEDKTDRILSCA